MLSITLRLNFCYLETIHILQTRYHTKTIRHVLKDNQKNKRVCIHEIIRLFIMKMKMRMKNRLHWYDINKAKSRLEYKFTKYKKCLTIWCLYVLGNIQATLEVQFMQKLSNTEAVLKKALLKRKACKFFSSFFEIWDGTSSKFSLCTISYLS